MSTNSRKHMFRWESLGASILALYKLFPHSKCPERASGLQSDLPCSPRKFTHEQYKQYLLQCRRSYRSLLLNAHSVQEAEATAALMLYYCSIFFFATFVAFKVLPKYCCETWLACLENYNVHWHCLGKRSISKKRHLAGKCFIDLRQKAAFASMRTFGRKVYQEGIGQILAQTRLPFRRVDDPLFPKLGEFMEQFKFAKEFLGF